MKDHLKEALLGVRSHLLKVKAGKYNEEEKQDEISVAPQANPSGGDSGASVQPQVSRQPEAPDEDFEKEKVEFFRKRKKPKIGNERVVGLGAKI